MEKATVSIRGQVVRGHRVASGARDDPRFPEGSIRPQLPFFRAAIPDFDGFLGGQAFPGTVNLRFAGRRLVLRRPEFFVAAVRWTAHFPTENFLLSRCGFVRGGVTWPAYIYVPDPATKPDHHQDSATVELLARPIADLNYGDYADLYYDPAAITIE
jgi:hypothetical protein